MLRGLRGMPGRRSKRFADNPNAAREPLFDQEIVFGELRALHFVAHPDRHQAAARPLQALVLLALIFWLRRRALAHIRHAGQRANRRARLVVRIDAKPCKLALEILALLLDSCGKRILKVGDVAAQLRDIHLRDRFRHGRLVLRSRGATATLLFSHENTSVGESLALILTEPARK